MTKTVHHTLEHGIKIKYAPRMSKYRHPTQQTQASPIYWGVTGPIPSIKLGAMSAGVIAILLIMLLAACATVPVTGRSQLMIYDEGTITQMGLEASTEIINQSNMETGTKRAARVQAIGQRIAAVAERPDFKWEFHTVVENQLNAFCLPGGKVFVYTGMLDLVGDSDDELAAVMGHEIAHAIANHSGERASQSALSNVGTSIVGKAASTYLGTGVGGLAESATSAVSQLGLLLPFSRKHESEADHIGVILAAKAGYDPRAAVSLWQKMNKASGGKEGPAFLSTHPLSSQRIKDLEQLMPEAMTHYKPKK